VSNDKNVVPNDKNIVSNDKNLVPNDKNIVTDDKNIVPNDKNIVTDDKYVHIGLRNQLIHRNSVNHFFLLFVFQRSSVQSGLLSIDITKKDLF